MSTSAAPDANANPHHYGSGEAHCHIARYKVAQYFGSLPAEISQFPVVDSVLRQHEWTAGTSERNRLWRILSTVREVQRDANEVPVTPLRPETIERDGRDRSLLKVAFSVTEMGFDPLLYIVDVGQPVELWGTRVTCRILGPPSIAELPAPPNEPTALGLVVDGLIGFQILGIETPIGSNPVLTDYRIVAAAAELSVPVPRGAVDVTVYQDSIGPASIAWRWFYGDPGNVAVALPLGELPFIAGQRRTHTVSVVPGVTHLQADVAALAARFFTIVWTIRP
jgi:hypothetical protein